MKFSMKNVSKNTAVMFMLTALFNNAVFAQGMANLTTMATNISTLLSTLSIVIITIAFCFVGYQLAFGGKRFADVMPVVIGAVIAGSALQLATLFATRA